MTNLVESETGFELPEMSLVDCWRELYKLYKAGTLMSGENEEVVDRLAEQGASNIWNAAGEIALYKKYGELASHAWELDGFGDKVNLHHLVLELAKEIDKDDLPGVVKSFLLIGNELSAMYLERLAEASGRTNWGRVAAEARELLARKGGRGKAVATSSCYLDEVIGGVSLEVESDLGCVDHPVFGVGAIVNPLWFSNNYEEDLWLTYNTNTLVRDVWYLGREWLGNDRSNMVEVVFPPDEFPIYLWFEFEGEEDAWGLFNDRVGIDGDEVLGIVVNDFWRDELEERVVQLGEQIECYSLESLGLVQMVESVYDLLESSLSDEAGEVAELISREEVLGVVSSVIDKPRMFDWQDRIGVQFALWLKDELQGRGYGWLERQGEIDRWPELVGEHLLREAWFSYFEEQKMLIGVDDIPREFRERVEIIDSLNEEVGGSGSFDDRVMMVWTARGLDGRLVRKAMLYSGKVVDRPR